MATETAKAGFSRIAGYIVGKNTRQHGIPMTSPVAQHGVKIAMTSCRP